MRSKETGLFVCKLSWRDGGLLPFRDCQDLGGKPGPRDCQRIGDGISESSGTHERHQRDRVYDAEARGAPWHAEASADRSIRATSTLLFRALLRSGSRITPPLWTTGPRRGLRLLGLEGS